MPGPFRLGDSLRVYRLQSKGVSLDPARALTGSHAPLWEACLALLTQQAMGQPMYVLSDARGGDACVQVQYRPHQAAADVSYLAPSLWEGPQVARRWSVLLDAACLDVAERGIQRVFANLPASGGECDVFHQAGFASYTGEDIYRLSEVNSAQPGRHGVELRPQELSDWPALRKLCVAITPPRVRQAEGGIALAIEGERTIRRYVLPCKEGDELWAALTIRTGPWAHWLRLVVHPQAGHLVGEVLRWALARLRGLPSRPVYSNVRKYEAGLRVPLEAAGFELCESRVLTVKHTAAWVKTPVQELAPTLKGSAEPVPPTYHFDGEPEWVRSEASQAPGSRALGRGGLAADPKL